MHGIIKLKGIFFHHFAFCLRSLFWIRNPPSVFDSGDMVRGSSKALASRLGFHTEFVNIEGTGLF